jgi:hypothetical protein
MTDITLILFGLPIKLVRADGLELVELGEQDAEIKVVA